MTEFHISDNPDANRLLNKIVGDLKLFSDTLVNNIKKLTDIGTSLSSERHIPTLLEKIVDLAMDLTNSDGATLYVMSPDKKELCFEIIKNNSLQVRMGGTCDTITWPPVALFDSNGQENHSNVSACVALTGKTINIPDVYDAEGFDFSGTREFDKKNDYRSKSMLVTPLEDHEGEILGVLQLLNTKNPQNDSIIPFSHEADALTVSLASQAAVALTKNKLINELEHLFFAFIRTIAKAIDEKSPYTGGHIKRVAKIAMILARKINDKQEGPYAQVNFTEDEFTELRIAAWMHDIGKITTPEYVIDKATKLETISDHIGEVSVRFELLKRDAEIELLRKKIELLEANKKDEASALEENLKERFLKIDEDMIFLKTVNSGGEYMPQEQIERVKKIATRKWQHNGTTLPALSQKEVYNLSIQKGTLNEEERKKIQDHVRMTEVMLQELPFPKNMKNVPEYACGHHETLAGTGYHKGLKGDEIKLQTRILALADIFEALSASDRPYKVCKKATEVQKILEFMVKDNHLDKDLFDLFINDGIFHQYVQDEYQPHQIDIPLDPK